MKISEYFKLAKDMVENFFVNSHEQQWQYSEVILKDGSKQIIYHYRSPIVEKGILYFNGYYCGQQKAYSNGSWRTFNNISDPHDKSKVISLRP